AVVGRQVYFSGQLCPVNGTTHMQDLSSKEPVLETTLIKPGDDRHEPRAPLVLQLGNAEQNAPGSFSLDVLWKSFRQRLLVTIPLGIIAGVAACAALWYFTEEKYLAMSTL